MSETDPASWECFADAVLQREGVLCRVGDGVAPREFAGMFVDHPDVDRILRTLPGLDGAGRADLGDLPSRLDAVVHAASQELDRSLHGGDRFARLVRHAGLDATAARVLAVLAAVEVHPDRQRLVMYVQDSVHLPRVTLHTIRRLFRDDPGALAALGLAGPLRQGRLVTISDDGPWATRMVGLEPAVVWHLLGLDNVDPELPPGSEVVTVGGAGGHDVVLAPGGDRLSRRRRAGAHLRGSTFLACPLPSEPRQWDAVIRQATLRGAGVILDVDDLPAAACEIVTQQRYLAWAVCSPRELAIETLPRRPWIEAGPEPETVTPDEVRAELGTVPPGHRFDPTQLRLTAVAVGGLGQDVEAAVRRVASGHLDGLAVRIPPRRGWGDLVLHGDQQQQLRELAARYRLRDLVHDRWGFRAVPSAGLVAAFAGPSGTGKTLAAEVIAGDLGLDLYKVDLSTVVSKYIGETEKNLERIFGAASSGNVVLFFDEADALFGKRSEVSDAHDRYANIEVSYLLQRLEAYDGLVVLATNLQRNMDQAFLRRIHVAVEFSLPDEDARRAIWSLSFPAAAPCEDLDVDFLARQFKLSGGSIRNVALGAAFLAAEAGEPIAMTTVALALKREFQKLGRLRTEAEFDRYFALVNGGTVARATA